MNQYGILSEVMIGKKRKPGFSLKYFVAIAYFSYILRVVRDIHEVRYNTKKKFCFSKCIQMFQLTFK